MKFSYFSITARRHERGYIVPALPVVESPFSRLDIPSAGNNRPSIEPILLGFYNVGTHHEASIS